MKTPKIETKPAHTPTPLKRAVHATGIELSFTRPDGFDESFATLKGCSWETAGEIVRAVNSHAELVAALEMVPKLLVKSVTPTHRAIIEICRAALAKEKGQP